LRCVILYVVAYTIYPYIQSMFYSYTRSIKTSTSLFTHIHARWTAAYRGY